jgi:hypothetical protein
MRLGVALALGVALLAGCATTRVVSLPAPGVALDPKGGAGAAADGVEILVRPSAWEGSPSYLPDFVTPFHLLVVNGTGQPLQFDYADLRLFDEQRFQYNAIPPGDVTRLLRWGGRDPDARLATTSASIFWRRPGYWYPYWWGPPYYWDYAPRLDDILGQALPVGTLQPQSRIQGYVYFPRLRREANRLVFEFHYLLGDVPRMLTLPFAVQRADGRPERPVVDP